MKKYTKPLLLLLLYLLGVFSFAFIVTFTVHLLARQNKEKTIFSTDCIAPCWRSITPGKTTILDAHTLALNFSDTVSESVKHSTILQGVFNAYISFELSSGIKVEMYAIDNVVILIKFYDNDGITTFERCISEFGPPEFAGQSYYWSYGFPVLPTQAKHTLFVALSPQKGVSYNYDTYTYFGIKKIVSPRSIISEIDFFEGKYYEDLLKEGQLVFSESGHKENILYPWVGFGNIFELYPAK